MPTMMKPWPCSGSWTTRRAFRRLEEAGSASRRYKRLPAVGATDPRGSSPTGS